MCHNAGTALLVPARLLARGEVGHAARVARPPVPRRAGAGRTAVVAGVAVGADGDAGGGSGGDGRGADGGRERPAGLGPDVLGDVPRRLLPGRRGVHDFT